MKQIYKTVKMFSKLTSNKTIAILTILLTIGGWNTAAWATYYATVNASSSPSAGGYVYVGTSSNCGESSCSKTSDNGTQSGGGKLSTSGSVTLYLCNKPNTNYVFKGWSTEDTNNSGSGANKNPWSNSFSATYTLNHKGTTHNYYAIFARLTANKSSITTFGSVNVGSTSSAQEVKITYVHAGKVTATLTGDFSFESSSSTKSKTLAENNTNTEVTDQAINIYFKPTCNDTRTGTLTIKGSNGMTDVEVSLSGTGVLNGQTLSWNNESSIELNMLNGTTQNISASA